MSNFIDSHCLQDVPRGNGILFEVESCLLCAPAHVGIRLKVEHKITACHFLLEPFAIKDVGAHHPDLGVLGMVADGLLLTSAEIVIDSHVGSNLSKPVDDVAPDKAGAASHEWSVYVCQVHNSTEGWVDRPMKFNL
jgi:hypothetical protein